MGDPRLLMKVPDPFHHLLEEETGGAFAQRPPLHHREEIAVRDQLHHDKVNLNAKPRGPYDNLPLQIVLN